MRLMNVVYVTDMARSVAFYEALGLQREGDGDINPAWNQFAIGDATLALHIQMDEEMSAGQRIQSNLNQYVDRVFSGQRQLQLNLVLPADGSLDRLFALCQERGIEVSDGVIDENFGRVFWVRDPDGLTIQFNELSTG